MYHIYSFTLGVVMATEGNHCILIPNPRDTDSMIEAIKHFGMTMFCGINTLFVSLCHEQAFKTLDFSRLKLTLSGGMALTENAAKQWQEVTGVEVHQGYGLTETSPVLSANPGGGNRINSIGLPVAMTEFQLRGEQGRIVGVGESGELCARGPQVMAGYWQRPQATAEVLDDEGWFMTGDIAVLDPDGYYRIVDRKKDMIIVSGFNVYPNELDDILTQHPGVLECAAIGVPDEMTGEAIRMFVVKSDPNVTEQDLIDYCRRELTGYKVPKQFRFVDELPKSAVGKILRRELRDGPLNH
jgi:long-chain acyl-CoA synthetase